MRHQGLQMDSGRLPVGIKTIPVENIILSTEFKLSCLLCNHQFRV